MTPRCLNKVRSWRPEQSGGVLAHPRGSGGVSIKSGLGDQNNVWGHEDGELDTTWSQ